MSDDPYYPKDYYSSMSTPDLIRLWNDSGNPAKARDELRARIGWNAKLDFYELLMQRIVDEEDAAAAVEEQEQAAPPPPPPKPPPDRAADYNPTGIPYPELDRQMDRMMAALENQNGHLRTITTLMLESDWDFEDRRKSGRFDRPGPANLKFIRDLHNQAEDSPYMDDITPPQHRMLTAITKAFKHWCRQMRDNRIV